MSLSGSCMCSIFVRSSVLLKSEIQRHMRFISLSIRCCCARIALVSVMRSLSSGYKPWAQAVVILEWGRSPAPGGKEVIMRSFMGSPSGWVVLCLFLF